MPENRLSPQADLLSSLAFAVLGDATLPWAVEHCRDGDPLPDAWQTCDNPDAMRLVVYVLMTVPINDDMYCETCLDYIREKHSYVVPGPSSCAACCAKIRVSVPALPSLDVIARRLCG